MSDINRQPFLMGNVFTNPGQLLSLLHVTNSVKNVEDLDTGITLADIDKTDGFFGDPLGSAIDGDVSLKTFLEFDKAFGPGDHSDVIGAVKDDFDSLENLNAMIMTGSPDDDDLLSRADLDAKSRIVQQAWNVKYDPSEALDFLNNETNYTAIMNAVEIEDHDNSDKQQITRDQLESFLTKGKDGLTGYKQATQDALKDYSMESVRAIGNDLDENFEKAAGDDDTLTAQELKSAYNVQNMAEDETLGRTPRRGCFNVPQDKPHTPPPTKHKPNICEANKMPKKSWFESWGECMSGKSKTGKPDKTDKPGTTTPTETPDTTTTDTGSKVTVKCGDTLSQMVLDYQKTHNRASQYSPNGTLDWSLLKQDIQKVVDANAQVKEADAGGNMIQPGWVIDLASLDAA